MFFIVFKFKIKFFTNLLKVQFLYFEKNDGDF